MHGNPMNSSPVSMPFQKKLIQWIYTMKIHKDIYHLPNIPHPVVTTGTFDGVHLAHQDIIRHLNLLAKASSGESVIITLYPHPTVVLNPGVNHLKMINTLGEKIALLDALE